MARSLLTDRAQTILTENVVDDVDYRCTINPYRGCEHACAACYARGSHEYLDLDPGEAFDHTIVVKHRAPELLRAAFDRPDWCGDTITFSSVTDPYQPIEQELALTRRCLEVCLAYRNPVRIVTRSALAARDLDLFTRLAAEARCTVDVSVAFLDEALGRALEPGAPGPAERFALIEQLARAGLRPGLMAAPIIAGLNDAQLAHLLERAAAAGAAHACWALVRLPEPTATVFQDRLRRALPRVADTLLDRARATRGPGERPDSPFHTRGAGGGAYVAAIDALFVATAARLGLEVRRFAKSPEPPTTFRRPQAQLGLF
ncbi:MAG TPA: radical SAM protein [Kofleriaceae bacterium]